MKKLRIMGMLRHVLTFGGGIIVGKGYIDEATMLEIVGGLVTIAGAAWSFFAPEKSGGHSDTNLAR